MRKKVQSRGKALLHGELHIILNIELVFDYHLAFSASSDIDSIYVEHVAGLNDLTFLQHIVSLSIWVMFLKMVTVLI